MKWLWLLAACSSHAPPTIHNEAKQSSALWCGSSEGDYACFTRRALCTAGRRDCIEIPVPHWACSRAFRKLDHSLHFETCLPSPELCAKDRVWDNDERLPCTSASSVYCRDFEDSLVCHPTLAICEREAEGFAGHIRPLSTCAPR